MEVNNTRIAQQNYEQEDLAELLKQYYTLLFPQKLYYKWLQYGAGTKNFENREFSFTLKDDVYVRYLSFANSSELEKELQKRVPYKIDIGAIYNYKPKHHKTLQAGAFKPVEKELVFDIDMTDYDDVRTCCSGASICNKCWMFMTVALQVMDKALEEDFGFKHRLWVYSGRRGIHCWVADSSARKLTQAGRSAVAEYLTLIKGGEAQAKKVNIKGDFLHPSLQRALVVVKKFFDNHYLREQNILDTKEQEEKMLKLIPDESTRDKVASRWNEEKMTTERKWKTLEDLVSIKKHVVAEIMFQYVYPRLDINVSKGLNHLLKSPFCVHPKTGRVCVPINPRKCEEFDPLAVPTVSQLLQELDQLKNEEDTNVKTKMEHFLRTSLRDGVLIFKKFVDDLEEENKEQRKHRIDAEAEKGKW